MGRPLIKFLTDFGPLLIFFIVYFNNNQDLKIAIPPFVLANSNSISHNIYFRKKNSYGAFNKWCNYHSYLVASRCIL